MLRTVIILFLSAVASAPFSQPSIFLENPSFEGEPSPSRPPQGWYFCGQPGESPPDVHPGGFFGVDRLAHDGATFVGMVVRDNGTNEGIGQRLSVPLQAGQCYTFSLYAARSEAYHSISRLTGWPANYEQPVALYIWGGFNNCDRRELLAQAPSIISSTWKPYTFSLQPGEAYTHLLIEAYFSRQAPPYNGNVLIDQASPLILVPCEGQLQEEPELEVAAPPTLQTEAELRAYLREQGRKVRFSADGILLEQHLFADTAGFRHQTNRPLWLIAQAMRQFPGHRLLIAVGGSSDYLEESHLRQFEYALNNNSLDKEQYILRSRRRSDRKREWLWGLEEREFLMWVEER
ncbi:MAG: hypothetical protein J5I94_20490 [Phaeodactylibacter sp.]|nr:hypothetical protein [Phaeodactylibacter sp.]